MRAGTIVVIAPSDCSANTAEGAICRLLTARGPGKTVCPSEVARALSGAEPGWRRRMGEVHAAVDALMAQGEIALSWKGTCLPHRAGPYRIGRPE